MSRPEPAIASRVRYLASCHEADNRESAIFDLFHKDVRHRYFFTGTEVLLSGLQDAVAVPTELGIAALEEASIYKRERSLVYGAFVLAGDDGRRLAAPLLYYPATLHAASEQAVFLRVDTSDPALNFPVLAVLLVEDAGALDSIARRVPSPPFGETELSDLMEIFREFLPRVRVDGLYRYPRLDSERDVRQASRGEGTIVLLPAAAMALVENPRSTRGVLSELARVGAAERHSPPLEMLLGKGEAALPTSDPAPSLAAIPAVLSRPQQKVLSSARRNPLTLIVGPPGTGKSYTVSALALEHVARGESVLIASRTEQALDVIESKLEAMLGETTPVLRGGSRDYARNLKDFLTRLLSGQLEEAKEKVGTLERRLRRCERNLLALERRIERLHGIELALGELSTRSPLGVLAGLGRRLLRWRLSRQRPSWELVEELERLEAERVALASRLLQCARRARIAALLEKHRPELKRFSAAVRARTSGRQEALFEETNLEVLLGAFPLWIATFRDLHRFVPFEAEMFDLVVVDEATQSDMASPLPALYRARRAAVTGDPKQLRHVSFLSRARQRRLGEEAGLGETDLASLDYREKSLLDLVDDRLSSQEQVAFLDEHFRSMPQIIEFSNREFYGGGLRIMTARPDTLRRRAVHLRSARGRRDERGVNAVEAEALAAELLGWVEAERKLPPEQSHSLGVLSPFRDQADHLLGLVTAKLDLQAIEKHDLLVGTTYGFQGEERDVVFLSLAVDPGSHPQAFRHVIQPDVFNVAVTRARAQQFVYASVTAEECPPGSLLQRYLLQAARSELEPSPTGPSPRDQFLDEVAQRLGERGLHVHRAFPAGGMTVDLVVEKEGRAFGIDLVGSAGSFAPALDLERYRMFRRAGLSIFPLSHFAWLSDEDSALDALERHFARVVDR